jgi:hypothetical protein
LSYISLQGETFVKDMDLLSPTHGLRSLKDDCTPGKHQEIETDISGIIYSQNIDFETGCADTAWSRY